MTTMTSNKPVSETLADLRALFTRYKVEDWEPIPGTADASYGVRYLRGGQWVLISSRAQPTKSKNLRQCYQVIQYLFLWASRGVGGVSQGVTFIHGGLVPTGPGVSEDTLAEAYAIIGVEPGVSLEEIDSVYRAKVKYAHPDSVQDPEEKRARETRIKRLNEAKEIIDKARKGG